jgi:hypothetical protein
MIIFTSAANDFGVNHTPLASLVFPPRRMTNYGASELLQDVFGKEKKPLSPGVWLSQAFRSALQSSWRSFSSWWVRES